MSKCGRPIYTLYRSPLGTDLLLCNRMGMWWGMHRQKRCLPQKANVWAYRQQWLRFWYETVWGKMPGSTYTLQWTMLGWLVCSYVWKQHVSQSISTSGTLLDYIWMKYIYLIFFSGLSRLQRNVLRPHSSLQWILSKHWFLHVRFRWPVLSILGSLWFRRTLWWCIRWRRSMQS